MEYTHGVTCGCVRWWCTCRWCTFTSWGSVLGILQPRRPLLLEYAAVDPWARTVHSGSLWPVRVIRLVVSCSCWCFSLFLSFFLFLEVLIKFFTHPSCLDYTAIKYHYHAGSKNSLQQYPVQMGSFSGLEFDLLSISISIIFFAF